MKNLSRYRDKLSNHNNEEKAGYFIKKISLKLLLLLAIALAAILMMKFAMVKCDITFIKDLRNILLGIAAISYIFALYYTIKRLIGIHLDILQGIFMFSAGAGICIIDSFSSLILTIPAAIMLGVMYLFNLIKHRRIFLSNIVFMIIFGIIIISGACILLDSIFICAFITGICSIIIWMYYLLIKDLSSGEQIEYDTLPIFCAEFIIFYPLMLILGFVTGAGAFIIYLFI